MSADSALGPRFVAAWEHLRDQHGATLAELTRCASLEDLDELHASYGGCE